MAGKTKSARILLRIPPSDDELFRKAADEQSETLSEFLVKGGRERAERVLADRTHFVLSAREWDAFVAALDEPGEARPELIELLRRPRPA